MNNGWIKLHRKLFENPVSQKPNYLSVWIYLLTHANHTEKSIIINNKKAVIKKGSFLGSISKISTHFNLTRSTVKSIIDYFESDKMLYTERTRNYTIFHILNYDLYQCDVHQQNTNKTPTDQRGATTKNDKNDKNEINIEGTSIEEAFSIYNDVAKKHGLPVAQVLNKERKAKLKARLKDCDGLEGWNIAMEKLSQSAFLTGKTKDWKASFDFVLQQSSFIKLMEGVYDNNQPKERTPDDELKDFLGRNRN